MKEPAAKVQPQQVLDLPHNYASHKLACPMAADGCVDLLHGVLLAGRYCFV